VAVTAPRVTGGSLLGKLSTVLQARSQARTRKPSRAAALIADHAGTFAALGFADAAAWHSGSLWGYLGTAAAILVAEFKVRG